jgi:predicted O-linked N-acetylglucosamine transferase (SPINDLY family)
MGAPYIDYLIADRTLIPAGAECHYTEKILFMPNSYQVNDRRRRIDERVFTRAELGLPDAAFVFCCFNNVYKITPEVFSAWMRILARVEAGVLWMLTDDPSAMRHLRAAARAAGISEARLIFAGQMPPPLHLARHRAADLFLDTLPYGAHTTASDALWAGLPVLTRTGASFAGRVAASLLRAVGVSELITANSKDYEEMAVALATQPERLRGLRRQIAANRMTCPLFDAATFARQLESGYAQIYEQYRSGRPPDHVHVPA